MKPRFAKWSCCGMLAMFAMVASSGCAENLPRAKNLKTANYANEIARTALTHPEKDTLTFPAFLVGVEKGNAKRVGAPRPIRGVNPAALPRRETREALDAFLNDPRAMFVSHVVEFETREGGPAGRYVPEPIYSVYATPATPGKSAWSDGDDALERLRQRVSAAATATRATHLIFWATGWNNTQAETITSLQDLQDSLMNAAAADGAAGEFRPVFVAMSWTSYWPRLGPLARMSLPGKTNDADEVGIVAAGRVLSRVLLPVRAAASDATAAAAAAARPKIVMVGHSLGARIVTWGAVSGTTGMTGGPRADAPVDLVVGLQGAFSANTFVKGDDGAEGWDGAPFAEFGTSARRMMYTSSGNDVMKNLPVAYLGKVSTHESFAADHPELFERRRVTSGKDQVPVTLDRPLPPEAAWQRTLLIDASPITADHNDVRNNAIGSLLWQAMR